MRNIFFDAMLTPKIITAVYWLALLGVLISGIGMMFYGEWPVRHHRRRCVRARGVRDDHHCV